MCKSAICIDPLFFKSYDSLTHTQFKLWTQRYLYSLIYTHNSNYRPRDIYTCISLILA